MDIIALDPSAATYVRQIHDRGLAGALMDRGDTDPQATLGIITRAVATYLPAAARGARHA